MSSDGAPLLQLDRIERGYGERSESSWEYTARQKVAQIKCSDRRLLVAQIAAAILGAGAVAAGVASPWLLKSPVAVGIAIPVGVAVGFGCLVGSMFIRGPERKAQRMICELVMDPVLAKSLSRRLATEKFRDIVGPGPGPTNMDELVEFGFLQKASAAVMGGLIGVYNSLRALEAPECQPVVEKFENMIQTEWQTLQRDKIYYEVPHRPEAESV